MNRKIIPLLFMLSAGALTCIITWVKAYPMLNRLIILLSVLILFYIFGSVLVSVLNYFDKQNEESLGEVIEKEPSDETQKGES
ncbi:MAG: hypothetical protein K6F84_08575 [Lachnospiraceae bacterium]|nr:hypothetical protein [Lachnospiraceae bacterium]